MILKGWKKDQLTQNLKTVQLNKSGDVVLTRRENKNNHRKFEGSSRKYKQQPKKAQTSEKTKRWKSNAVSWACWRLALFWKGELEAVVVYREGGGRWCGEGEVGSAAKLKQNQPRAQHADTPTYYRAAGTSRQLNYRSPRGPSTTLKMKLSENI